MLKFINRMWADPGVSFITLLLLALGTISVAVVAPTIHEAMERKQCAERDWPLDKEQAMLQHCQYNGYEIGKLGPAF